MQALYSGISSFGFGRVEAMRESLAALASRSAEEVTFAMEYTVQQALHHAFAAADADGNPFEDATDQEAIARAWHFLQAAVALSQARARSPPLIATLQDALPLQLHQD